MHLAVVRILSGLAEEMTKRVALRQALGVKRTIHGSDRVRIVVKIFPDDGGAGCNRNRGRLKCVVLDCELCRPHGVGDHKCMLRLAARARYKNERCERYGWVIHQDLRCFESEGSRGDRPCLLYATGAETVHILAEAAKVLAGPYSVRPGRLLR